MNSRVLRPRVVAISVASMLALAGCASSSGYQMDNQAAAEHARTHPRSRLWQMVDSARRMLGAWEISSVLLL